MPYSFLQTMIKERNIKHKTIQNELGISKTMFSRKINGSRNGKFTLEEAIKIKEKFFSRYPGRSFIQKIESETSAKCFTLSKKFTSIGYLPFLLDLV